MAASDPVTAVANVVGDSIVAITQLQAEENTPAQIDAKRAKMMQAHKDAALSLIDAAEAGSKPAFAALRILLACLAVLLALVSCTIAPPIVTPERPPAAVELLSASTNGFLVTSFWAERYTNLCQRFGDTLNPPMKSPRWISPAGTNFLVSKQAVAAFYEMDLHWHQLIKP